jgi:hypothetical protein
MVALKKKAATRPPPLVVRKLGTRKDSNLYLPRQRPGATGRVETRGSIQLSYEPIRIIPRNCLQKVIVTDLSVG